MTNLIALIVTLGILVTIHEYGHFWVARRCGVRVLRFSVGFGKPLLSWHDRHGTEFCIAAIPLGGYVRMLDEREGEVAESERSLAFNTKSVYQRFAIVAAGPLINIIFAVLVYWWLFVVGVQTIVPVIGEVVPGSPAALVQVPVNAEITAIDGHAVRSWEEVNTRLAALIGETTSVALDVKANDGKSIHYQLPIEQWLAKEAEPDLLNGIGMLPWRPHWDSVIGEVVPGQAAEVAGLKEGDKVLSVDGDAIASWSQWVDIVQRHPDQSMQVALMRGAQQLSLTLTPHSKNSDVDGRVIGYIGAAPQVPVWPDGMKRTIHYGVVDAFTEALHKTSEMVSLMVASVGKLVSGLMSVESLGGPITIAKVAGASASSGLESFVSFLAYLSISLGVLNLLPIPMLDGGHLLFFLAEMVKGKPVSDTVQMISLRFGMVVLGGVMLLALYNDLMRL
ncbi:RIP metalloprotease RseP [Pokkaliibacter plantistimulans]|uniref:Zinc metalloprotease n=1 Tax=Proteobacteria bacterium 228 TaxID=2083153 RepID=A0A2S5KJG1_9PROT|nr:RIP metalloprotease RseP [Pokkaliibacter plantistimulans]PPC74892.1 RIP metalloprotease RseP [Pokkaliibacter plantistimulans]